jgi:hypothetical protein
LKPDIFKGTISVDSFIASMSRRNTFMKYAYVYRYRSTF